MNNRKKICALIFLMVLGTTTIAGAEETNPSLTSDTTQVSESEIKGNKEAIEKAEQYMKNKDYQSAIVYLSAYIGSKPKKYEGYKLRGDCFYALRQYALAEKDYQTAIDLKAGDDKFMTGTKVIGAVVLGADKNEQLQNPELGTLYSKLMYAQKAQNNPAYENSYVKAMEYNSHIYLPKPKNTEIAQINCPQKYGKILNPQGVDEYIYGAIDDIENGHFSEAVFKVQYVTSNYPKYYLGHYLMGVVLVGLEQEKDAVALFNEALKYNPYDFESFASLGQIYYDSAEKTFSADDAKKSIEYFNKALQYNPDCYIYYFYIGLNDLQMGNVDLAISNFDKAVKLKSNDYNSMYYKLIAQYIKGDYNSVIDGATKLLYKHVSNYSSVLYLRALAYQKSGSNENALADLEKIQSSINDIYNADIKVVSEKEKTLNSYIHYLKAQLTDEQGFGSRADMVAAMQNPIIAKLAKVENSVSVYDKDLNSESLTLESYRKYNDFYTTSLPKMLQSNLLITVDDIDNQYDYIRTTFDNLGVTFKYEEPYYKMTTIDDYVYKKYSSKLSNEDRQTILASSSEDVKSVGVQSAVPRLKPTTEALDTLGDETKPSIAQILASQSFPSAALSSATNMSGQEKVQTTKVPESVKAENPIPETVAEEVKTILTEEPKQEAVAQTVTPHENGSIVVTAPNVAVVEAASVVSNPDNLKLSADEIKAVPDFKISYNDGTSKAVLASADEAKQPVSNLKKEKVSLLGPQLQKSTQENLEKVQESTSDAVDTVKNKKTEQKQIVEKYAKVNPNDFDFVHKPLPEIDSTSDVVELEPYNSFIAKAEKQMTTQPFNITYPKQNSGNSSATKSIQNADTKVTEIVSTKNSVNDSVEAIKDVYTGISENPIVLPETENKTEQAKTSVAVPAVIVPHLEPSVKDTSKEAKEITVSGSENKTAVKTVTEKTVETVKDNTSSAVSTQAEKTPVIALRPQVELTDDDKKNIENSAIAVKPSDNIDSEYTIPQTEEKLTRAEKRAAKKLEKQRAKEQAKAQKVAAKQEKITAKQEAKQAKATAKAEAKAQKLADKATLKNQKLTEKQAKVEAKAAAKKAKAEEKAQKAAAYSSLKQQRANAMAEAKQAKKEAKAAKKAQKIQAKANAVKAKKEKSEFSVSSENSVKKSWFKRAASKSDKVKSEKSAVNKEKKKSGWKFWQRAKTEETSPIVKTSDKKSATKTVIKELEK